MFNPKLLIRIFTGVVISSLCLVACNSTKIQPAQQNELVFIPAGWFTMGEDDGRYSNQPQHQVYLDEYYIQRTEVTRMEFNQFVLETGHPIVVWPGPPSEVDALKPVVGITWKDADVYCKWLGMRLPTEAEWEKAARGDDGRKYPWGDEWNSKLANTKERGIGEVVAVGSYPNNASPYGVLDMTGNAIEWVADFYAPDYYQFSPESNPKGPDIILDHGLRGGSFDSPTEYATTYFRDSTHLIAPNLRIGFRCASSEAP